jgi:hypothetical protein
MSMKKRWLLTGTIVVGIQHGKQGADGENVGILREHHLAGVVVEGVGESQGEGWGTERGEKR